MSDRRGQGRPVLDCDGRNRLYGDVWLLEQIAEKTKIRRDLEAVFDGNKEMVDAIMALAMFPYLTKFNFSRVRRWQRNVKSPCYFPLSPKTITRLQRMVFGSRSERVVLSMGGSPLLPGFGRMMGEAAGMDGPGKMSPSAGAVVTAASPPRAGWIMDRISFSSSAKALLS